MPLPAAARRPPAWSPYVATARNSKGSKRENVADHLAPGALLTQVTMHVLFFDLNLPWETARPVWWHTNLPLGQTAPDKIDIGFFPDADWGTNYQGFTDGMQTIARGAFFDGSDQFSNFYRFWKDNFNLWAGPAGGDGEDGCVRSLSGSAATVGGAVDGKAIVHQNTFRDCSDIALGGLGTSQSTLTDAAWVFTHESGHFLHALGDEYVGGGNGSGSDPPNTWTSKSACQTAAPGLGFAASKCAQIGTTGFWDIDDGQLTTMRDRNLASDWRTASGLALGRRMAKRSAPTGPATRGDLPCGSVSRMLAAVAASLLVALHAGSVGADTASAGSGRRPAEDPRPAAHGSVRDADDPVNKYVAAHTVDGLVLSVTIDGANVTLDQAVPRARPQGGAQARHRQERDYAPVTAVGLRGRREGSPRSVVPDFR